MHNYGRKYIYFKRPISAKVLVCPLYIKTKKVVHFTETVNVSNLSLDPLLYYLVLKNDDIIRTYIIPVAIYCISTDVFFLL